MNSLEDAVLVFKLIAGIKAVESPDSPVPVRRAALYARAALYHSRKTGVDPFELLALARNESDFNDRAVGPDGLDCGVTQIRVTYSVHTCEELKRSPWLAYSEAAKELASWAKSCQGREDFDRCRLNRYNSGIRYARRGFHGRYYLRVTCLAEAARQRVRIGQTCRNVRSPEEMASLFGMPAEQQAQAAVPAINETSMVSANLLFLQGLGGPVVWGGWQHRLPPPWAQRLQMLRASWSGTSDQPVLTAARPLMRASHRRDLDGSMEPLL